MKRLLLLLLIFLLNFAGTWTDGWTPAGSPLATDAETVTGTATSVVTTPANITAKMAAPGTIGAVWKSPSQESGVNAWDTLILPSRCHISGSSSVCPAVSALCST